MRRPSPIQREPAPRWLVAAALLFSLVVHGVALLLGSVFLKAPELDIELTLPMDVELGTAEALTMAPPSPAAPEPTSDPAHGAAGEGAADAGTPSDAGPDDAAVADAGPPDAGPRARDAGVRDASPSLDGVDGGIALAADAGAGAARLPPGAQIALRVDMTRLRNSPVAPDVRRLLAAIPDWKALLEGSGIDPMEQLDRLLIATPNLQREKIVLAGRYVGGEQVVREAVARLGAARGTPTPWRTQGNVPVAPWANQDRTPRVIAIIGPTHFAIARDEDLPRILAIASARGKGKKRKTDEPHPADALLSMEENEGLSVEVEGVAQFVRRGRRGIPERLRLSAVELPRLRAELRGVFSFNDEASANDGVDYWSAVRDRYAGNALVALLGLADPLEDMKIEREGNDVRFTATLTAEQLRLILGYLRELVAPPSTP